MARLLCTMLALLSSCSALSKQPTNELQPPAVMVSDASWLLKAVAHKLVNTARPYKLVKQILVAVKKSPTGKVPESVANEYVASSKEASTLQQPSQILASYLDKYSSNPKTLLVKLTQTQAYFASTEGNATDSTNKEVNLLSMLISANGNVLKDKEMQTVFNDRLNRLQTHPVKSQPMRMSEYIKRIIDFYDGGSDPQYKSTLNLLLPEMEIVLRAQTNPDLLSEMRVLLQMIEQPRGKLDLGLDYPSFTKRLTALRAIYTGRFEHVNMSNIAVQTHRLSVRRAIKFKRDIARELHMAFKHDLETVSLHATLTLLKPIMENAEQQQLASNLAKEILNLALLIDLKSKKQDDTSKWMGPFQLYLKARQNSYKALLHKLKEY